MILVRHEPCTFPDRWVYGVMLHQDAPPRLKKLATRTRAALLRADAEVGTGDGVHDDLLCDLAVQALADAIASDVIEGEVVYHFGHVLVPSRGVIMDHWWISVGEIAVDITAAQFGSGPVIVCPLTDLPWTPRFSSSDFAECRAWHSATNAEAAEKQARAYGMTVADLLAKTDAHDRKVLRRFRQLMAGHDRAKKQPRKAAKRRERAARRKARRRR